MQWIGKNCYETSFYYIIFEKYKVWKSEHRNTISLRKIRQLVDVNFYELNVANLFGECLVMRLDFFAIFFLFVAEKCRHQFGSRFAQNGVEFGGRLDFTNFTKISQVHNERRWKRDQQRQRYDELDWSHFYGLSG